MINNPNKTLFLFSLDLFIKLRKICQLKNFCLKKKETTLVVGDNIRTDIIGANNMNFDSLLVTHGIHKNEFTNLSIKDYDKILANYNAKTNYYQEELTW